MKDGEVIYKAGYAEVVWCEKCKDQFTRWPKRDEIIRSHGKVVKRQCCEWNRRKSLDNKSNKIVSWPDYREKPVDFYGDIFDRLETIEESLGRWSRE